MVASGRHRKKICRCSRCREIQWTLATIRDHDMNKREEAVEIIEQLAGHPFEVLIPVLNAPRTPNSLGALAAAQFRRSFSHTLRIACDNDFSERRETTIIQTIVVAPRRTQAQCIDWIKVGEDGDYTDS